MYFSWMASQQNKEQLHEFISGLGPGQLVGRQVLGSPVLGDIQLSLVDKRGNLEVEVIRARGLQSKPGSKILPAPWVKVYLVSGKKCLAKAKTGAARRTLDPLFQQQLIFHQRYGGCVLQVIRDAVMIVSSSMIIICRSQSGVTMAGWRGPKCLWVLLKFCLTTWTCPTL